MGRVINYENAGKKRAVLCKKIVISLRELIKQSEVESNTRDLASFIALALLEISQTVEESVVAWEKRGYWLKADRFRLEWIWTDQYGLGIKKAIAEDNWNDVATLSVKTYEKLKDIKIPQKKAVEPFWVGSYNKLIKH